MNRKSRILTMLLAGLMLLSTVVAFTGCANEAENPSDSGTESATGPAVTEPETDPLQDALDAALADVDWGGEEFGILYVNEFGYAEEVEIVEEKPSVINEGVHKRNTLLEEQCKLEFVLIPTPNSAAMSKLQGEVQTATGDFQLHTQTAAGTASAATSGYLYNYLDLNIDYEKPWWDAGTLDFALDGKVFFMNGPFNIVDDDVTFVFIFNKKLREEYQVDNPYELVKNGTWTLEMFNSIISKLATENGDGTWDEKDTYGFSTPASIGNTFFYASGLKYVANSRDMAEPELVLTGSKMEQALNVLSIARSIVRDSYVAAQGSEALSKQVFIEGRSLFYCEAASYLRALNQEMDAVYGIVPVPKYSKEQENYTTWSHDIGSTLSIPTSVAKTGNDMEQFALVLEIYTLLSQQYVRPAYYDNMLTTRNVHDSESAEMMDLIFLNKTYDMAMYFHELGFNALFSDNVAGSDKFASQYQAQAKTFDRKMRNILKKLQNAN